MADHHPLQRRLSRKLFDSLRRSAASATVSSSVGIFHPSSSVVKFDRLGMVQLGRIYVAPLRSADYFTARGGLLCFPPSRPPSRRPFPDEERRFSPRSTLKIS